ncbi:MAG: tRNA (adenosine(37)-N6)-threonylcarbamoyltransferase complex ATPase subunit type 1 TsaE [Treponema sp.]|jgi:tRNA threonylcarbamoyladenosine biosynthesis protein TsaE|nr:tRNA (adenosine(37)-N6)-threonylcarbamoyltransferase complex ATPase subunit type 1 TsaE [Treponema sp.]
MKPGAFLVRHIAASPEETMAVGEKIAAGLGQGSVVALRGGLGAGKTCLVKGIARGLGIREELTSPTYTIVSEYAAGPLSFYHIDAYRLGGDEDFQALGGDEYVYGRGIAVIEWSDRIPASIPRSALLVSINILEDGRRSIAVEEP